MELPSGQVWIFLFEDLMITLYATLGQIRAIMMFTWRVYVHWFHSIMCVSDIAFVHDKHNFFPIKLYCRIQLNGRQRIVVK